MEQHPTAYEHELAATRRQQDEESMRGSANPGAEYPPPDEATPPAPAPVPEPYPPDEIDVPNPDPDPDGDDADAAAHSSRSA